MSEQEADRCRGGLARWYDLATPRRVGHGRVALANWAAPAPPLACAPVLPHRHAMAERRRGRAARRDGDRLRRRLAHEIEALARLEVGGSPARPMSIDSVVLVEVRAVARPCPLCGGPLRLVAHTAEVIDGARLRVATVACATCAVDRAIYFRLDEPPVH